MAFFDKVKDVGGGAVLGSMFGPLGGLAGTALGGGPLADVLFGEGEQLGQYSTLTPEQQVLFREYLSSISPTQPMAELEALRGDIYDPMEVYRESLAEDRYGGLADYFGDVGRSATERAAALAPVSRSPYEEAYGLLRGEIETPKSAYQGQAEDYFNQAYRDPMRKELEYALGEAQHSPNRFSSAREAIEGKLKGDYLSQLGQSRAQMLDTERLREMEAKEKMLERGRLGMTSLADLSAGMLKSDLEMRQDQEQFFEELGLKGQELKAKTIGEAEKQAVLLAGLGAAPQEQRMALLDRLNQMTTGALGMSTTGATTTTDPGLLGQLASLLGAAGGAARTGAAIKGLG